MASVLFDASRHQWVVKNVMPTHCPLISFLRAEQKERPVLNRTLQKLVINA